MESRMENALKKHVWLKTGGYLIIEYTEAMTVIDVNTGKFDGNGKDKEKTFLKINLEAVDEIADSLDDLLDAHDELEEKVDEIDSDLADVEDFLYDDEDDDYDDYDEDEDDFEDFDDDDFFELECPNCGEDVLIDFDTLDGENDIVCPNCHKDITLEFETEDEE